MQIARMSRAPLAFAAALVLGGLVAQDLRAQSTMPLAPESKQTVPTEPPIPAITIRIAIASASEQEGELDPAARDIFEQLPGKYHSIHMIEERTIEVIFGEQARVELPTGSEVRLLAVAVHGGQLHLQLEMPELLNTSMRMANNRAFYVGGVPYGDGTLVFKLVPEFSAYVEAPALERSAPPETQKAKSDR